MRKTEVRLRRRWWLNPSLLATIFVFFAVIFAISGSLDQQPMRESGNHYWETFIQRPALAPEDSVVIGTWRRDVRLSEDPPASVHCGLRSYGLTVEGEQRFLENVASGRAEGWRSADPNDPLPSFVSRDTPCLRTPDTFMSSVLEKIRAAWANPENPRYRRAAASEGMDMRGVYDDRSGQVFVWFVGRPN